MTSIDERVVQMRFDNGEFERKVRTTLESLKNLKNGLNFSGSVKNVQELNKATSSMSFDGLARNVETISSRFSNLGIVGVTALQNITNSAMAAGTQLVKSLTIDPVKAGFNEYELKMGSIQTIMAATGASLEEVNHHLDELNEYSDKTIYSFSDMTQNIGKFTNAGVKLEDAVLAMKGISNEAAISGANANEASRAMYNFAQALSSGSVKLIDWKSIELANMGTQEFKQELIDTALALGTVVEQEGKYRSTTKNAKGEVSDLFTTTSMFNESLNHQWMTTDVLIETLKRYADETTDLGRKAFSSAQDIKTFSMLIDTWREAAQSGWAMTWQLIVGDFEEAKQLFTNINAIVGPLLDGMAAVRNNALKTWASLGGRTALFDGLYNIFKAISSVLGSVGKAFSEVFNGDAGQILYDLTIRFKNFTESLIVGDDLLGKIKNTFTGVFTVAKFLVGILTNLVSTIVKIGSGAAVKAVSFLAEAFFTAGSYIADCVNTLVEFVKNVKELEVVKAIGGTIRSIFESVKGIVEAVADTFGELAIGLDDTAFKMGASVFEAIANALEFVLTSLNNALVALHEWISSSEVMKTVSGWVKNLATAFRDLRVTATNFASSFKTNVVGVFNNFKASVKGAIDTVKEFVASILERSEVQQFIKDFQEGFSKLVEGAKEFFGDAWEGIKKLGDAIKNADFASVIEQVKILKDNLVALGDTAIGNAATGLSGVAETLTNTFSSAVSTGNDAVGFFTKKYKTFADFVGAQVDKIDMGTILAGGLTGSMTLMILNIATTIKKVGDQLANFLKIGTAFTDMINAIQGTFTQLQNVLKARALAIKMDAIGNTMLKFAGAVGILALSIGALTMLDQEKLKSSAITLGIFAGGLIAMVGVIGILDRVFKAGDVEKYSTVIIGLAVAVGIMAASLRILDDVNPEGLIQKVAVLGVLVGIMTAAMIALSRFSKTAKAEEQVITTSSLGLLAMAASMLIMAQALKVLGGMNVEQLAQAVPVILVLAGIMGAMVFMASKIGAGSGAALLLIATSLGILTYVFHQMAGISPETLNAALPGLITSMFLIGVLMRAASLAGEHAARAGVGILAMSAGIILIAQGIKMMAEITPDMLESAMQVLTRVMLLYALLMAVMKYAGDNSAKAGVGILAISAGIVLVAGAILLLAQLDEAALARATLAVMGLQLMFSVMIASTKNARGLEKTLIPMVAAIAVLAGAVVALSLIDPTKLAGATVAMSLLMTTLSLLVASTGKAKSAYGQIAFLMLVVVGLAAILSVMSTFDASSSVQNAIALSLLLTAIAGTMQVLDGVKKVSFEALGAVAALTLVVAGLGVILYALKDLNPESSIATAISLSVLLVAMSGCCAILQFVNPQGALLGVVGLIGLMTAMGAFMAAVGWLNSQIPELDEFINSAIPLLQAVGEGIGSFVGGIVGGALSGMASSLPSIGDDLSNFMQSMKGFFTGLQNVPEDALAKVGALTGILAALTGASMLNALSNIGNIGALFGGESALGNFGKDLEEFAPHIVNFGNTMAGVDVSSIQNGAAALKAVAEAASALDPEGGLMFLFEGERNYEGFAKDLPKLAEGIKGFANGVAGIGDSTADIQAAADGIKILAEAQDAIDPTGGLIPAITGYGDLGSFGKNLVSLGRGISSFALCVKGIGENTGDINSAVEVIKKLGEAQDAIDPSNGFVQMIAGYSNLGDFGNNLTLLGGGLQRFSTNVVGISGNLGDIDAAIEAVRKLGEIKNSLGDDGGLVSIFTGDNKFSTFSSSLSELGRAIMGFANEVANFASVAGNVTSAVTSLSSLSEVVSSLNGIDFGTAKLKIADFKLMIEEMNGITSLTSDVVGIASAIPIAIQAISDALASVGSTMYTSGYTTGMSFTDGLNAGLGETLGSVSGTIATGIGSMTVAVSSGIAALGVMASDAMRVVGEAMGVKMVDGIKAHQSEPAEIAAKAVDSAKTRANLRAIHFTTIGASMMSGLAAGIRNNQSQAINAAVDAAVASYRAAKDAIDMNSPSKKFMYIGEMADAGFAIGFSKYADVVTDASSKVGRDALDGARKTVDTFHKYVNSDLGGFDYQPKIVPVVEANGAIGKITQLNGMLDITKSADLTAKINADFKTSYDEFSTMIDRLQNTTNLANDKVKDAIDDLKTTIVEQSSPELAMYVDSRKLASSIAKPMNQQLGVISRRGEI